MDISSRHNSSTGRRSVKELRDFEKDVVKQRNDAKIRFKSNPVISVKDDKDDAMVNALGRTVTEFFEQLNNRLGQ